MRLAHLARRFFESVRARPLDPVQQRAVEALLQPGERPLFWGQQPLDQRHAYEAAASIAAAAPDRLDLRRAALLHDVGKRHARLGVIARVLASLTAVAGLRARGRWAAYLDHAALGAADLAAIGSDDVVVAFARHHHEADAPPGVDAGDWALLRAADGE
ncbi:MAG: HDIG domain-containing protein [Acidimicrobiia bacterium]|nr:HDIG domain-containing protein [Acidimicrobiia bacterium]